MSSDLSNTTDTAKPPPLRLRAYLWVVRWLGAVRPGLGLRALAWMQSPCRTGGPYHARTPDGFAIEMNPRSYIDLLLATGLFSNEILALLPQFVTPQSWAIDLGANVGGVTLRLAHLCAPGGKVIAYEPNPAAYHALCRNVKRNHLANVVPVRKGAYYEACVKALFTPAHGNLGTASIYDEASNRGGHQETIELEAVDDCWRREGAPPVSLVKLDIQGAEVDALRGMQAILRACHPAIIAEYTPAESGNVSLTLRDLAAALEPHGYTHVRLIETQLSPPLTLVEAKAERYLRMNGDALFYVKGTSNSTSLS